MLISHPIEFFWNVQIIDPLTMKNAPLHISIVGFGNIGRCAVNLLMQDENRHYHFNIIDPSEDIHGSLLDIGQAGLLHKQHDISWNDKSLFEIADFIIYSAGVPVPQGKCRNEKLEENRATVHDVFKNYKPAHLPIIISLTNPLEAIAREILKTTKLPAQKVVGIGTIMESLRMEYYISQITQTPASDIQAMVIGEHGETMVPVLSQTRIAGTPIKNAVPEPVIHDCIYETRRAAHRIKDTQGASYFTAANAAVSVLKSFLLKKPIQQILSIYHPDEDIYYSVPVSLSEKGYAAIPLTLTAEESESLNVSKEQIKAMSTPLSSSS